MHLESATSRKTNQWCSLPEPVISLSNNELRPNIYFHLCFRTYMGSVQTGYLVIDLQMWGNKLIMIICCFNRNNKSIFSVTKTKQLEKFLINVYLIKLLLMLLLKTTNCYQSVCVVVSCFRGDYGFLLLCALQSSLAASPTLSLTIKPSFSLGALLKGLCCEKRFINDQIQYNTIWTR